MSNYRLGAVLHDPFGSVKRGVMSKFTMPLLLAGIIIAISAAGARACINDREINKAEREFKSSYPSVPSAESISPDELTPRLGPRIARIVALGMGAGLLLAAAKTMTFTKRDS
jgi:hypothetical protein